VGWPGGRYLGVGWPGGRYLPPGPRWVEGFFFCGGGGGGAGKRQGPLNAAVTSSQTHPPIVTLGCFTNGTIAQVVTNSLSPLSGQHLYDGSGATV